MSLIKNLHQKLIKKEVSAVDLVNQSFKLIEEKDKDLKAFITLTKEEALKEAEKVDKKISQGEEIDLISGLPFALKDNILTKGIKTTAASKILADYYGSYDATVFKKLKEKGAILIGKTNLDEFAMGSSTENSAFFTTKNPYDLDRVAGGSSGGSAVAVSSSMAVFALGSDTGGSIREPAAFCGVVGFKPSYGSVSRYGLIPMASSLDVIGPITKTVEDARIIFETIAGKDEFDSTSFDFKKEKNSKKEIIIGLDEEFLAEGVAEEIKEKFLSVIKKIEEFGLKIKNIDLTLNPYALSCYYIIMPAEVSANLARYDGLRYSSLKDTNFKNLEDIYFKNRGLGFGKEVRRRILLGTYVLSHGYYDAYYRKAQKVRRLIKEEYEKQFQQVDFIISPTTPTLPFKIGEKISDPLAMYLSDIFTVGANIAGLPAINLPIGFSKSNLPIGLQITAPYKKDFDLLDFSQQIEKLVNF